MNILRKLAENAISYFSYLEFMTAEPDIVLQEVEQRFYNIFKKEKYDFFVHYTEPDNVDLGDSVYKTDSLEKARDFMDMMENKGLKCKLYLGIEYDSHI